MDDMILFWLLVATVVMSLLLLLASAATLGRKLADMEYLGEAGINGVRGIQTWINVRTHANRVLLAIAFLVISILTLADTPDPLRLWVSRVLLLGMLASYTVNSVLDWRDERRQMRLLLRGEGTATVRPSEAP